MDGFERKTPFGYGSEGLQRSCRPSMGRDSRRAKTLNIWIVTIGEPWPIDGENPRLHKTGTMARMYARGGDQVTWFNSTFDHYTKSHRFDRSTTINPEPNLTLVGLQGRAYAKNVSFQRIGHHRDVAADWERIVRDMPPPDVVVASMPPLELSRAAVRYGKRRGVPVVVDIRDLWPDIFLEVFPKKMQWAGRLAVSPFYAMLKESVRKASAVSGVSEHAVDWALAHAGKARGSLDGALPLAYTPEDISDAALARAGDFWDAAGIRAGDPALTICFFGSLTPRIELETVLEAARRLPPEMEGKLRFVLCGTGQRAEEVAQCAARSPFLIAPGWVDAAQIVVLMRRSQIGILPYKSTGDFIRIIPNKIFDYLSGGLPILTSLVGVTGDLVQRTKAGWMYRNDDPGDLVRVVTALCSDRAQVESASAHSTEIAADYSAAKIYGEFRNRLDRIIAANTTKV